MLLALRLYSAYDVLRKKSSKATLCCGFRFFGGGGRRSSWLFYVRFPDVRNFKDSCGNLSGVFLLLTSRGSLKLYYPVLHSNQPYTIIQLFLPSKYTVCAGMVLEAAGSHSRKGLSWFAFAFSSCPLHFSYKVFIRLSF